jgi:hypothetical protein
MTDNGADEARGDGSLYVITLCTASLPMVLRVPFVHELEGFSVFRSRTVEEGRERFRLYVGYFDSATRAHEALAVVRKHYASAWISCAPRRNLGSLDDTMNTAFGMIRRATARVVSRPDSAATPGAASNDAQLAAAADEPVAPFEEAPPQRYVVQLDWSETPVPSGAIPQLAVLRAYNLYRAHMARDDGDHYALRLGFFKNVHGARQVAEYLRVHFPRVGVVPVSHREYTRALELFEGRAQAAADATARAAEEHGGAATTTPLAAIDEDEAPLSRTREELLALLGADQLEVGDDAGGRPGDEGDDSSRRRSRNVRSW